MAREAGKNVFGKRQNQHVLILASGNRIRHMTLKPWMTALGLSLASAVTIGYFAATTYLVLRDDLLGASMARQARVQHEYEDRISALRAQVDRVTSRQLLDQQVVEKKVEKLMAQQVALTDRHGRIDQLLERAENAGGLAPIIPVPKEKPRQTEGKQASLAASPFKAILRFSDQTASIKKTAMPQQALGFANFHETSAVKADRLFGKVAKSLKSIEKQQISRIKTLRLGADEKANAIAEILSKTGIKPAAETDTAEDGTGGPYIPVENVSADKFDLSLSQLDLALQRLEQVRNQALKYPFGNPIPGAYKTSGFGYRKDPFLGTIALHPGIDFHGKIGDPVRSTGTGVVIRAGRAGGYGNMVEIDHGHGIHTRYGHLSAILVHKGEHIETGDIIGKVGSTGRSTGPHLHYEVRRNGVAINPTSFLNAGLKLTSLL